jgi:hypothetical protein
MPGDMRNDIMDRLKLPLRRMHLVGVLAAILLMTLAVLIYHNPGVKVVIINGSDVPVRDLYLRFVGGVEHIPLILPAHTASAKIYPSGDSGLGLEFLDAMDHRRHGTIDVYMEQQYAGTLVLRLDNKGTVHFWDDIKIRWYFPGHPRSGVSRNSVTDGK